MYRTVTQYSDDREDKVEYYNSDHELLHVPSYIDEIVSELRWLHNQGVLLNLNITRNSDHPLFKDHILPEDAF